MTKLSKYEKETIINWNEAEDTASIYTFNADLKRRLAEFSRKHPQLCWLERSTTEGSVTYVVHPSGAAVQRGAVGGCQRIRQTARISGLADGQEERLKPGQFTGKWRV